ncbi:unnamed protein product, partial [Effrenium voratum]
DWCSQLLRRRLHFGIAEKLLDTEGAEWDYCGKDELLSAMQETVQTLHDNKGVNSDKQRHPLFLVFAGPGQGKSRFLTEFPSLVMRCLNNIQHVKYQQEPLAFLLTCENGTQPGDWLTQELNAQRFVACRMLWQLREANATAFAEARAPNNFAKFRAQCSKDLTAEDVLRAVLTLEEVECATIVLGIDGMQNLSGFTQRAVEVGKKEPFYQVMQEVCRLINQKEAPFVVGCVTATQSMDHGLATSPQARKFLQLPSVTQVTVNKVDQIPNHPLKHLLVMDMGGHGRALEGLVGALTSMESASGDAVVGAIMDQLTKKYPQAGLLGRSDSHSFDDSDIKGILRASLSGKWIAVGSTIEKVNPEKMMLIRLQYNSDQTEYRIHLPYVWLHMMLSRHSVSSDLQPWRLMDYSSFVKGAPTDGTEWELFNANFRVSSCCGNPKPFKNSDDKTPSQGFRAHQCKAVQDGKEITVTMTDKTTLLLNAKGAPAADAFVMLEQVNSDGKKVTISECLQMKHGQAAAFLEDELKKACDRGDILVLLRNTCDE